MKIYITGANGFIGKNLIEFYKDHTILKHQRNTDIQAQCDWFKPDVIFHCAAEIYNPEVMFASNIQLTHDCLEYVKEHPDVKLIYIGSSAEYGPMDRATKETDRINPVDMYQATKGAGTLLCQGYARQYNLDIKIARVYSAYGNHEKPHRLFSKLYDAFYNDQPMTLFDGYHDFIYIKDFIRGLDILANDSDPILGDIVNFGSGTQYSNLTVLNAWQSITGRTAPVIYEDKMNKAFESKTWCCDTRYAEDVYNFKVEYTLEEGIRDLIEEKQNAE